MPKPPSGRLPFEPKPLMWRRGPASRQGQWIVMDDAHGSDYMPALERRLPYRLARVRTERQAIAFVNDFGLLHNPKLMGAEAFIKGETPQAFPRYQQKFEDFVRAADWMRTLINVRRHVLRVLR